MEQTQRRQKKVSNAIALVQEEVDRFRSGLKVDREYMERRADDGSHSILCLLGTWVAKRVFAAQQTYSKGSKVIINRFTSAE